MKCCMKVAAIAAVLVCTHTLFAGPYSGPTDTAHAVDAAIRSNSPLFVEWASDILPVGAGTYFAPGGSSAINKATYNCLGDLTLAQLAAGGQPGYLTVTFPTGIKNGPGADFACFENAFSSGGGLFAELAYVEVSSNGVDFIRFPSVYLNYPNVDLSTEVDSKIDLNGTGTLVSTGYLTQDVSNIYNLAGKHAVGYGTPFDLAELADEPLVLDGTVNLNNIQYVKLVDVIGNGSNLDSLGNPIFDAWVTWGTGGYDFRLNTGYNGVGVINVAPEPVTTALLTVGGASLLARRRGRMTR